MSREVRRVPKGWQHPKNADGTYQPMYDRSFTDAMREWITNWEAWERGERPSYCGPEHRNMPFWEWDGPPPDPAYYRPDWPEESRTHLVMYEDTSEGTPISPAFETPEDLARWLTDNGASAFAGMTATYEQWLRVCKGGFACSMIIRNGHMTSGVEGLSD